MSDTEHGKRKLFKTAFVFLAFSAFCLIFSFIYGRYGHGVYSNFMTFTCAYPLIGGAAAYLLVGCISRAKAPERFAANVYNSGIAALTVGSMLRGIFDIAGTSSPYQPVFVALGTLMVLVGVIRYIEAQFKNKEEPSGN